MEGADIIQFVQIPEFYHKLYQQTIKHTRTSVIITQKDGISQFRNFGVFSIPGLVLPTFLYFRKACYSLMEKEMAPHSSTLAWKIPRMEEPGRRPWGLRELDTTEQLHFLHFTHFILYHWRREWQPSPVFLPGESHGQRSLAGHGPWDLRESDMIEVTKHARKHNTP